MNPHTSIADSSSGRLTWGRNEGRSTTLNRVKHHLILQVGSKDVLVLRAQILIVRTILKRHLVGSPEESELSGQFLKDRKLEVGILLDTETGTPKNITPWWYRGVVLNTVIRSSKNRNSSSNSNRSSAESSVVSTGATISSSPLPSWVIIEGLDTQLVRLQQVTHEYGSRNFFTGKC